jgi:hypothetical protein
MDKALDPLTAALKESQEAFTGSEQEREALDKAYKAQVVAADYLTQLEEQMVPEGYVTPVPPEYSDLPQLKKRATVEMTFKKGQSGAQFNVNGVNYPEAKLVMIIDGYTGTFLVSDSTNLWCHIYLTHTRALLFLVLLRSQPPPVIHINNSPRHGREFCRFGIQGILYQYEDSAGRRICGANRPTRRWESDWIYRWQAKQIDWCRSQRRAIDSN